MMENRRFDEDEICCYDLIKAILLYFDYLSFYYRIY